MSLQNRVQADGTIVAHPARGTVYGNRGGKFHDVDSRLLHTSKRWASRQWICCQLQFNNRYRPIMGHAYTELFFLDDVTAFAAGHRPCFECRRKDFMAYALAWQAAFKLPSRPRAADMDRQLHNERLDGRMKRLHTMIWDDVPEGAIVQFDDQVLAKHAKGPLLWSLNGYRPSDHLNDGTTLVQALTPPATMSVLRNGYAVQWHESAYATL